jgi:hypothetical protein
VTALTFGIMSYGTNENNPNFHQLLFTENFPVIANDYTTVQFLFIPYWGFLFDLYNRKLLLGGKFFHGIYFSQLNENYINCTSIYLTFKSSDIILEFLIMIIPLRSWKSSIFISKLVLCFSNCFYLLRSYGDF